MNVLVKIVITLIAIINLLFYPFQSFIQKELAEYGLLFEQYYNYSVIAMFLGAAIVLSDVWRNSNKSTGSKIIWTIVLLFPFPALSCTVLFMVY